MALFSSSFPEAGSRGQVSAGCRGCLLLVSERLAKVAVPGHDTPVRHGSLEPRTVWHEPAAGPGPSGHRVACSAGPEHSWGSPGRLHGCACPPVTSPRDRRPAIPKDWTHRCLLGKGQQGPKHLMAVWHKQGAAARLPTLEEQDRLQGNSHPRGVSQARQLGTGCDSAARRPAGGVPFPFSGF